MKIGVLIKQVPDSETKVKVKVDGSGIETADIKYIMNPYDEFAVEEALKMQARHKGEVVVFTVGSKKAEDAMRNAMAMGADRGIRVEEEGIEGSDALGIAHLLAAAVKAEACDILFAGKQAIDDDSAAVPQMVAELLDWPQITVIDTFEAHDEHTVSASRRIGGGTKEVIKTSLPAVITADKGLNSPRFASLPGIMKAKKKPLVVKTPAELGVTSGVGARGSKAQVVRYSLPAARKAGRVLKGDLAANVTELVKLLHDEAKVI